MHMAEHRQRTCLWTWRARCHGGGGKFESFRIPRVQSSREVLGLMIQFGGLPPENPFTQGFCFQIQPHTESSHYLSEGAGPKP